MIDLSTAYFTSAAGSFPEVIPEIVNDATPWYIPVLNFIRHACWAFTFYNIACIITNTLKHNLMLKDERIQMIDNLTARNDELFNENRDLRREVDSLNHYISQSRDAIEADSGSAKPKLNSYAIANDLSAHEMYKIIEQADRSKYEMFCTYWQQHLDEKFERTKEPVLSAVGFTL